MSKAPTFKGAAPPFGKKPSGPAMLAGKVKPPQPKPKVSKK